MSHSLLRYQHTYKAIAALVATSFTLIGCVDANTGSSTSTTGVSGTSGTVHTLSASEDYAITKITWAEGGLTGGLDVPCYLKVTFRELNDVLDSSDPTNEVTIELNVCNSSSYTTSSQLSVNITSHPYVDDPNEDALENLFVNEVRVCDSKNSNNRLKGISIYGAFINGVEPTASDYNCRARTYTVNESGTEYTFPAGACQERDVRNAIASQNNCDEWKTLQSCPSGMIASGLRVHTSSKNEITGLALNCKEVEYTRTDR